MEAARLAPIVISPLNVAFPLASKVIPFPTEPICIPLESIESLVVLPSLSFNVVEVSSRCSVAVFPIVVVAAKLALSTEAETICTPLCLK